MTYAEAIETAKNLTAAAAEAVNAAKGTRRYRAALDRYNDLRDRKYNLLAAVGETERARAVAALAKFIAA